MTSSSDGGSATHYEFRVLLLIAHYYGLRSVLRGLPAAKSLVANISTALLRHSDIIPADKAFYEAGIHARVCIIDRYLIFKHTIIYFVSLRCYMHD